jgi:hypothetical protein
MTLVILILMVLIAGIVIYFIVDTKKTSTIETPPYVPNFQDEQLQKKMLREAQSCTEAVMTTFDKMLDYSEGSIRILDQVINDLFKKKSLTPNDIDRLVVNFGAYFGQTFLNNQSGMWFQHPNFNLPIIFSPKALFEFSPFEIIKQKFQFLEKYDLYISYQDVVRQYIKRLNELRT